MSLIRSMRRQYAAWWSRTNTNGKGQPTYTTPVEIPCRWDQGYTGPRTDSTEMINVDHTVYVDRDMKIGDLLLLLVTEGQVASSGFSADPKAHPTRGEVRYWTKSPNYKNTDALRTAFLKKV